MSRERQAVVLAVDEPGKEVIATANNKVLNANGCAISHVVLKDNDKVGITYNLEFWGKNVSKSFNSLS
jgi:hypothetical protein